VRESKSLHFRESATSLRALRLAESAEERVPSHKRTQYAENGDFNAGKGDGGHPTGETHKGQITRSHEIQTR